MIYAHMKNHYMERNLDYSFVELLFSERYAQVMTTARNTSRLK